MGLDGVEIVMEVEDHFGITITDEEASEVRTVGDLLALIESRFTERADGKCQSLPAFLRVRRFTREFLESPELRLRPSTQIASVISLARRLEFWKQFHSLYGTSAPELCRPALIRYLLVGATCIVFFAALSTLFVDPAILPAGLAAAALITFLMYTVTRSLKLIPPSQFSNFGDATRKLVGLKHSTKTVEQSSILSDFQKLVADTLGVDRDEVVPNARFIEDLDCD
jgi:acyl carrier protein